MNRKALLLKNTQSPGDILMLTAAVRDLHKQFRDEFEISVATSAKALWDNNPYICDKEGDKIEIGCEYPLIHRSNSGPWHFIHAFHHFIGEKLGVHLEPTEFRGDIHLSERERHWMSQIQEITKMPLPFWIVVAGGKKDFTAKWWDPSRMQAVVDHFRGKILFVQVGEKGHHHPALRHVLDLRGKTSLRQFVRLMHHAQGVVCPVTFAMHLAAAVPTRGKCGAYQNGMPKNRPCVVVAGGREPMQWEAYPHHQFIHTNGALRCCDNGGCWKSRVLPLNDGDGKDNSLCLDVVRLNTGERRTGREWTELGVQGTFEPFEVGSENASESNGTFYLPKCLDLIDSTEVLRRVDVYFDGGAVDFLSNEQVAACRENIPNLAW